MRRILIKNADWIITMDDQRKRYKNGDILIEDGIIVKVGKNIGENEELDEIINAAGMIITPGFINVHDHFFQALIRNIPELNYGMSFDEWISTNFRVFKYIDAVDMGAAAAVAIAGLLKSGCTTSCDHHMIFRNDTSFVIDAEIEAAKRFGIRFHPMRSGIMMTTEYTPDILIENLDAILEDSERLIRTHDRPEYNSMLRVGVAVDMCGVNSTVKAMKEILKLARKFHVRFHAHLSDDMEETDFFIAQYGCRPVELAEKIGLSGKDVWFAHCCDMNEDEMNFFARSGTAVSHSPSASLQTASLPAVPYMLEKGIAVGIGTDGSSNGSWNMMKEMYVTYLAHAFSFPEKALTTEQVLEMATVNGAKVLGRNDIGSISPGMAADIVLFNWDKLEYDGARHDPVECIVLSGDIQMIDTVMVNGKIKVKQGNLVDIEEDTLKSEIDKISVYFTKKIRAEISAS